MKKLYFLAGALILASAPFVFGAVDLTRVMQVIMLDGVSGTPISSSNPLPVTAGSASASAGQYADDADFTDGTSVGVLGQAVAESASPTAVTEGDVGALAMTLERALKVAGGSKSGACSNADVDTIETLCSITVTGYDKCSVTFTVATAVLSDFNVDLANDATTFVTIATSATDYTSPQGHIYGASGDLTVAATSGTHFIEVDGLTGWDTLRFQAAGTSSAVTGTYRCSKE